MTSTPASAPSADPARLTKLIACFALIYLVWGSSYVAMKIGVANLAPATFAGVRFTLAGAVLALVAGMRGSPFPTSTVEWRHAVVMGALAVFVSAGINNYAIQWVPSNQSALINTTSAFWIAGLATLGPRGHSLTARAQLGLIIGFVGAALIVWPHEGFSLEAIGPQLAIVLACASWALGTLYYRSVAPKADAVMFTGLQMLMGGVMLLGFGAATGGLGEWHWSWGGAGIIAYQAVFSSCLAYSAYTWLMVNTTPDKLATYSYVNPAVAAVLGWLLLDEHLTGMQLAGMLVILAGVALVTWQPRNPFLNRGRALNRHS